MIPRARTLSCELVCLIVAAISVLVIRFASAADLPRASPHFPSNEELRHVQGLVDPQLSPEGRRVLFGLIGSAAEGGRTRLWLVDIPSNRARPMFADSNPDVPDQSSGRWTPDGSAILFLTKKQGVRRLVRQSLADGATEEFDIATAVTYDGKTADPPLALDIQSYALSPDGVHVALIAKDPETSDDRERRELKNDAILQDHDPHRDRLYLFDLRSRAVTLTGLPGDAQTMAWAPSGDRLIAISDPVPVASGWLVESNDPTHPKRLEQLPNTLNSGTWSHDGKEFYYLAQSQQDAPPGYFDLYRSDLATGSVTDLSDGFEGSIGEDDYEQPPVPLPDGVLQSVEFGTRVSFARFANGKHTQLDLGAPVISSLNSNQKRSGYVWLGESTGTPARLFYADRLDQKPRVLNTPPLHPGEWLPAKPELVHWNNEGLTIEGLLFLPPQANTGKIPLIVVAHGGPSGASYQKFEAFVPYLLGQGWAVFEPNPRGSLGYGAHFVSSIKGDLGGADFRDIMTGVDWVIAHAPIDAARLAFFGYSYGGEMAAFVEGKTDRYKAVVCGAPMTDQQSEYGSESDYTSWYDRWYLGKPWEHPEDSWRQSPLAYAAHARTPFLLLQGDSDTINPPGQSLEIYRALRQSGVRADLVFYPREDHGPLSKGILGFPTREPWHGFDARQRVIDFVKAAFGHSSVSESTLTAN